MINHPSDALVSAASAFRITAAGQRRGVRYEAMTPKAHEQYAEFFETVAQYIRDLERRAPPAKAEPR